jgi:OFA family oxalate/formate antiporter-like MFS transporter
MKKKSSQVALVIAAMATVGSIYGWSITATILSGSGAWPAKEAISAFGLLSLGIGAGVVVSGLLLPALGYAKTVAAGLVTWGLVLLVFSQLGFPGRARTPLIILAVVAGAGVGLAYLALVSFFRTLFAKATVISGLIGPLGFATGAAIISLAQAIRPSIDRVVLVSRSFGIGALGLGILVLFFLVEPRVSRTPVERTSGRELRSDLLYFWVLLSLNVVPGMAVLAIAVPWFCDTRSWSPGEAGLALSAAVFALPIGQTVWGMVAHRFGSRAAFFLMFSVRALAFAAAFFSPQSVWPWSLLFICLACHGGGFGLLPTMVAKSRLGSDPRMLGLVLSGWGAGGVAGVLAILPVANDSLAQKGYAVIAGLMAIGMLLSVKIPRLQTAA